MLEQLPFDRHVRLASVAGFMPLGRWVGAGGRDQFGRDLRTALYK